MHLHYTVLFEVHNSIVRAVRQRNCAVRDVTKYPLLVPGTLVCRKVGVMLKIVG